MNIAGYIQYILLGIGLLWIGFGALTGLSRGWIKALVRLAGMAIAAVLSLFVCRFAFGFVSDAQLQTWIAQLPQGDSLAQLTESHYSMEALRSLAVALLAPLLFPFIYFIINKLMLIPGAILNAILHVGRRGKGLVGRLVGLLIGAAGGVLSLAVLMTPVGGYMEVAQAVYDTVSDSTSAEGGSQDSLAQVKDLIEQTQSVREHPVFRLSYGTLGSRFFTTLSRISYDGEQGKESTTLEREIAGLQALLEQVQGLQNMQTSDPAQMDLKPLNDLIRLLESSDDRSSHVLARMMAAGVLSSASGKWLVGESFLGITPDSLFSGDAESLRPAFNAALELLEQTTPETVAGDLFRLTDTMECARTLLLYVQNTTNGDPGSAEDIAAVLKSLQSGSAELLLPALEGLLGEDAAQNAPAEVLDSLLNIMQGQNMTDAELEQESQAIHQVLSVALPENGTLDTAQAGELVESVLQSQVMSELIVQVTASQEDKEPVSFPLSGDAAQTLEEQIAQAESGELTAQQQQTLNALRTFFGL